MSDGGYACTLLSPAQARDGLYYNAYFPGGMIVMPQMLVDGGTEYDDGTPANVSQQAKDVVTFLQWTCYPFQVRAASLLPQLVCHLTIR